MSNGFVGRGRRSRSCEGGGHTDGGVYRETRAGASMLLPTDRATRANSSAVGRFRSATPQLKIFHHLWCVVAKSAEGIRTTPEKIPTFGNEREFAHGIVDLIDPIKFVEGAGRHREATTHGPPTFVISKPAEVLDPYPSRSYPFPHRQVIVARDLIE